MFAEKEPRNLKRSYSAVYIDMNTYVNPHNTVCCTKTISVTSFEILCTLSGYLL